jgi:hypothetical protein
MVSGSGVPLAVVMALMSAAVSPSAMVKAGRR